MYLLCLTSFLSALASLCTRRCSLPPHFQLKFAFFLDSASDSTISFSPDVAWRVVVSWFWMPLVRARRRRSLRNVIVVVTNADEFFLSPTRPSLPPQSVLVYSHHLHVRAPPQRLHTFSCATPSISCLCTRCLLNAAIRSAAHRPLCHDCDARLVLNAARPVSAMPPCHDHRRTAFFSACDPGCLSERRYVPGALAGHTPQNFRLLYCTRTCAYVSFSRCSGTIRML
jgi:hypothetical protein